MRRACFDRSIRQAAAGLAAIALFVSLAAAQSAGSSAQDNSSSANSSAANTPGQRTDGQIEMDVVHALDAQQSLNNDLITAATIHGEVTLSGTVSVQAEKDLAGSVVSKVPGVSGVQNNLTIGNPQAAAQAENLPEDQNAEPAPDESQAPPQNEPAPEESSPPDNGQANAAPEPPPSEAQPGQYPAPNPPTRPDYVPNAAPPPQYGYGQQPYQQQPYARQPQYQPASGPVTIAQGTLLEVRTAEPVDSKHAKDGTPVEFTLIQDVTAGGVLAIPRGATLHGVVTHAKNVGSGKLAGRSELALTLTSLDLGGRNYPIQSGEFMVKSPNKAGETVGNAVGGGILGAIIGCAIGRGPGCAIGAGAGAAAGVAGSAASPGPRAWIPAEALVTFHLAAPVTVVPVSPEEAARLAQGLYAGGPRLYRRGYPPPGYYRPYGYPPYAYPPVYYRPYYMVGGVYYWR